MRLPATILLALACVLLYAEIGAATTASCSSIPACVKQSTTTCKCSRCQTIPGCSKYDTTTCKCTRASPAAYVVLPSGVTGCAAGYGSFRAQGAGVSSTLPLSPPSCPVSALTLDLGLLAGQVSVDTKACACKRCPSGTTSQGGFLVELSQCRAGINARAFAAYGAATPCGAYLTGVRAWYSAARSMIVGLETILSDGSSVMSGIAKGNASAVSVPSGQKVTTLTVYQTGSRVEALRLATDAGVTLNLGKSAPSAPRAVIQAPLKTALGGISGALAYPGGPLISVTPLFNLVGRVTKAGTTNQLFRCTARMH
ncbi:hypothetical protein MNEG_12681 [Monoraphidium neglectum]|uniref:Uncharacterized protein n=1 Tax=Monoraphidium neglectum TaxID=145388 RepID=A0A0D2J5W9_9CHLO|nr:hypothetical protein MNEG_12681 [Monoraphidium neglectum]KIY95282.1 hypothetical protein MNEG_12681 [Monoraphidium neglectum]|eukprot:XP_013894302.1 hypothetical protein MNEG_12681 [Monoraphidium neglectum]